MTLQQFEYIVALDIYRHYVTAAEKCFVTQPTITLQVQKLEEEIGIQLFDRSKTPLVPTDAGKLIIQKAKIILDEVNELKATVNHKRDDISGEFRIGIIPTVSPYIVPGFTGSFSVHYPDTRLNISEMQSEAIIEALNNNEIDLGILVTPLNESHLREIPLYNEPFVFYGSDNFGFKHKKHIQPKDIEKLEGLWLLNSGHCFRNQILNICHPSKKKKQIQFQSGSIETLKKMVDNYGGYTLVPELAITGERSNVIHFKDPKPIREVSIVVKKTFIKEHLIDALRKEILHVIPKSFKKNERFVKVKWR